MDDLKLQQVVEHAVKNHFEYPHSVKILDARKAYNDREYCGHVLLAFSMGWNNRSLIEEFCETLQGTTAILFSKPCSVYVYIDSLTTDPTQTRKNLHRGTVDIEVERANQYTSWTDGHDDAHECGELAKVAAVLATAHTDATVLPGATDPDMSCFADPWGLLSKYKDTKKRLAIAGALIAAEIDRINRKIIRDAAARRNCIPGVSDEG